MTDPYRMGTAARGRQSTAARNAARLTTAQRQVNLTGVGYNTKVNSVDRPVTNHGMMGMTGNKAGPGRQIYDRNYYANLLKNKNIEIANEITKMNQEVEDITRDNSTYVTLERKYENLIKDVRRCEGELADYNLALDKHRSDTKAEDIDALYMHIRNQNDKQKHHLDGLFGEKRDMENEIASIEQQIQEINYANEAKLNDLDPEQRNDYEKYKNDNNMLLMEIQQSRNELDEINQKLQHAEQILRQDTLKQRSQHLRDEKTHLLKRKEDLELQTNEMNLPFPEARERLMNRIKQDNAEIKQQEKEISEMRKVVDQYQRQVKEITNELMGKPNEGS
jgi:intraflagellar transport protein 74